MPPIQSSSRLTSGRYHGPTPHAALVGRTGTGKSTLLVEIATQTMIAGHGLLVLDPHGDAAGDATAHVPRRRRNDLLKLDPFDNQCPGLNPLRGLARYPDRAPLVISGFLATMKKLFPESWGPRTQHVLRHALAALAEVRSATLLDAQDMLADEDRRAWVVRQVRDPRVRAFWTREFVGYGPKLQAEATAPPLNKLSALLAIPAVREVLTKRRPVLDVDRVLARSRIVVASLPKGLLGEDGALVLGGVLLGAFQVAIMARAKLPAEARAPFTIIVDEVGSFATQPFLELLAEARKFGVRLVLATQSLAALEPLVRQALLANVGELVSFRVGADDAEIISAEMLGMFTPKALMMLDVGERIVREGAREPRFIHRSAPAGI